MPRNRCIRASMRRRSAASAWLSASPPHVGTWRRRARTSSLSAALPPRPAIRKGRGGALRVVSDRHGLRASQLCSLRLEQVDLVHARLHVSRKSDSAITTLADLVVAPDLET